MGLSAPKRTAEVVATGVPRIGQKEDPAIPAAAQTSPEARAGTEHRPKRRVVGQNESANPALAIPAGPELETLLDSYERNPSTWLRIESLLSVILASYVRAAPPPTGILARERPTRPATRSLPGGSVPPSSPEGIP